MIPYEPPPTRAEKRRAKRAEEKAKNPPKYPQPVSIYTQEVRDGKVGYLVQSNYKD